MNRKLLTLTLLILSSLSFGQGLEFDELGSEPSFCRLFSYQNGGGIVFASATGGTPDYTYLWEQLETGETYDNAVWGGRNPGDYRITITDAMGEEITETFFLDSVNVVANFNAFSDDLTEVPGGYTGFAPDVIGFENTSTGFANPIDPLSDTTFFWNFDHPDSAWNITYSLENQYYGYLYGGEYEACLVAINNNGCKDTICKTIDLFGAYMGLNELDPSQSFDLISHPNSQSIGINQSGFEGNLTLSIYNVSGQVISRENISSTTANLPFNHPNGVYFYALSNANEERLVTGKFNF